MISDHKTATIFWVTLVKAMHRAAYGPVAPSRVT